MIDLENPALLDADYEEIKTLLLKEIKNNYIPPDGETVFYLNYN